MTGEGQMATPALQTPTYRYGPGLGGGGGGRGCYSFNYSFVMLTKVLFIA